LVMGNKWNNVLIGWADRKSIQMSEQLKVVNFQLLKLYKGA